jgi:hypothetical protein
MMIGQRVWDLGVTTERVNIRCPLFIGVDMEPSSSFSMVFVLLLWLVGANEEEEAERRQ